MATLATQSITRAGLEATYAAAAGGGDKFAPDRDTLLHVKNASGGDITVTIVTQGTVVGNPIADNAVVVTAGEERFIGPFPYEHYSAASDGLAAITYSGVTSLTIAAFKLSQP